MGKEALGAIENLRQLKYGAGMRRNFNKATRKNNSDEKKREDPKNKSSVVIKSYRHSCDVFLANSPSKPLLKIGHAHFSKLRELYKRYGPKSPLHHDEDYGFKCALFRVLARYQSLSGHGFQAALNEEAFEILNTKLGVDFECFASPLNSYFGNFCSAFPDTDSVFGSVGSFFDLPIDGTVKGSFEANPPFISLIMTEMALHIHKLMHARVDFIEKIHISRESEEEKGRRKFPTLAAEREDDDDDEEEDDDDDDDDDEPDQKIRINDNTEGLTFVVIVPGWKDEESWTLLSSSPFLKAKWIVAKKDHGFCDGAQHQRKDRYRESPYDTGVFILQTPSAAEQWKITDALEMELKEAMAKAVPTPAAQFRRKKEGRGMADADGGGGVYKGRKRKNPTSHLARVARRRPRCSKQKRKT
eukprot:CAMPEP_0184503582 /NCGR_PEP_ID=MMETSP0113_2-20130426/51963_1 /TAXON_ID=91329 /ORGANISM="Norrisiella sphaerica, Strain BC52" /LENGTH=414 /DNA_ID=CAMNT_0026893107 /DNA_START=2068 /DNA_END=3312 /DNA_ORIENTATION=+